MMASKKSIKTKANGPEISKHPPTKGLSREIIIGAVITLVIGIFVSISSPMMTSSITSTIIGSTTDPNTDAKHHLRFPEFVPCTNENLANVLLDTQDAIERFGQKGYESGISGFHVLCIERDDENDTLIVELYARGVNSTQELSVASEEYNGNVGRRQYTVSNRFESLRDDIEKRFRLRPDLDSTRETRQPWALYTPSGGRVYGAADVDIDEEAVLNQITSTGMIYLFTGGAFIWPTVRVGFEREIDVSSIISSTYDEYNKQLFSSLELFGRRSMGSERKVILETLSIAPTVFAVKNFLSNDECDFVKNKAEPRMKKSSVSHNDQDKNSPASKWRTSSSTFLYAERSRVDDTLHEIDRRVASLTRIPRNHHEQVQVLRYNYLEKYNAHHDYFDNALYRTSESTQKLIQGGKRNRLATVFWYLSDVKEGGGGETIFPRWNRGRQPSDMADCSVGMKVRPEKGKVIIFYSMLPDGSIDTYSLHGACPVLDKAETKWAANKWIWNANMGFIHY